MKIVFVCVKGIPAGGGIEKYTEELGSRLVQRGHEVLVYSSKSYGCRSGDYKGMRIKALPSINTRSMQKLSVALLATLDQFFEPLVDVVHYHAIGPSIFCLLPRLAGRKTLVQSHGHEWMRAKWGLTGKTFFRLAEFGAMYFPHCISAVSRTLTSYYTRRYGLPVTYIPTGVAAGGVRPPDRIRSLGLRGGDYILFMARLVAEKGAHHLVEAYLGMRTDVRLVIAGDALYEASYKAKLKSLAGGNPNIIFTGHVQGDLQEELYSNARLFVLPSEVEGLPIALLEAMSYGLPCVVSDIPENIEALGGCGFSFRSRDVRALRQTLEHALEEPDRLALLQQNARLRVRQEYDWESITDEFERLYSVLSGGAMTKADSAGGTCDRGSGNIVQPVKRSQE